MTEQSTAEATASATRPALVYTRLPTEASWTEVFYDGSCKVVKGRIEKYKDTWVTELCSNRGFSVEGPQNAVAETVAESSVAEEAPVAAEEAPKADATPVVAEAVSLSGQAEATVKPSTKKKVKGKK